MEIMPTLQEAIMASTMGALAPPPWAVSMRQDGGRRGARQGAKSQARKPVPAAEQAAGGMRQNGRPR